MSIKAVVIKTEDNPNYVWYKPWISKLKTWKYEFDFDTVTIGTSEKDDEWVHTITGTRKHFFTAMYDKKLDSDTL